MLALEHVRGGVLGLKAWIKVSHRFVDTIETCSLDELWIVACPQKQAHSGRVVARKRLIGMWNMRRGLCFTPFTAKLSLLAAAHVFDLVARIFEMLCEILGETFLDQGKIFAAVPAASHGIRVPNTVVGILRK